VTGRRSDSSLAALLLTQRLVDNPADPLKAAEFWALVDTVGDPGKLLGLDTVGLAAAGLAKTMAERVGQRFESATAFAFELERLEQTGVQIVSGVDADYPVRLRDRLGTGAPPVLHVAGPVALLTGGGLGVVGSRNVSPEAAATAREAGRAAVERGLAVISGAARGVDELAMTAALDAGGTVVGVLAESLPRRLKDPDTRRAILAGKAVFCTPYKPSAGFSVANAMGRNRIIYGLSDTTLVVTAEEGSGGTWSGAVEALRRSNGDVAVWTGAGVGAGNAVLVAKGGRSVETMANLFEAPTATGEADRHDQLSLGLESGDN
jgi:predicted Rossmann fold nucleotide-binding protein DprA/Smf involved in DNA uptake